MTWIPIPKHSDFTLHNLPFGIFSHGDKPRVGVAVGDHILDLTAAAAHGLFDDLSFDVSVFSESTLNAFIGLGKSLTCEVRRRVGAVLRDADASLKTRWVWSTLEKKQRCICPWAVGDYTDFYSSIEHATNVGKMFRDPENALLPNWRHLPVGYHGRASSIVVSGTSVEDRVDRSYQKGRNVRSIAPLPGSILNSKWRS